MVRIEDACEHCRTPKCISDIKLTLKTELEKFDDLNPEGKIKTLVEIGQMLMSPCGARFLSKCKSFKVAILDMYKEHDANIDAHPEYSFQYHDIIEYLDTKGDE